MDETLRGREPGTDEIVGETPETGPETDVGNPEQPADAEAETRAKIREQAMAETRAHFEAETAGVEAWLATPGYETAIVELSQLAQPVDATTLDGLSNRLGLPAGMRDLLPAMLLAIDHLKPIVDQGNARDQIKKFIREKFSPSVRLGDAMRKYDAGTSWYHTTPEGRSALERISGDAKDSANKE